LSRDDRGCCRQPEHLFVCAVAIQLRLEFELRLSIRYELQRQLHAGQFRTTHDYLLCPCRAGYRWRN